MEILLFQENLWLTQAKMAELFEVQKAAISKHLKNIFESGELSEDSVVSKMETTAADGKRYQTNYYNLDAIIAVGYRVNSKKATMFRIWANRMLKEFIIKGYVMDDARLREPENFFGKDYFEEQLERIRDIRASERRFYQKITDIYSQCSADYDVESPITKEFFATVQNKLHYAVTHHTAAEIVYGRQHQAQHGPGHMEKRPQRPHPQIGCHRCQKLSERNGNAKPERDRHHVPGLCGTAGPPGKRHLYGRLGQTA